MEKKEGSGASIPEVLLARIKGEAGKPLEDIEKEWIDQLTARHEALNDLQKKHVTSAAQFFEKAADEHPERAFLIYGGTIDEAEQGGDSCPHCSTRTLTYGHVDHASNAVAAWAMRLHTKKLSHCTSCKERSAACGECLCNSRVAALVMHSSPEYVIVLLGLLKAGMTVALLHPQMRGLLLQRAMEEAGAEMLICDDLTVRAVREAWLGHSEKETAEGVPRAQERESPAGSYPFSTFICGVVKPMGEAGEHSLVPHVHRHIKELLTESEVAHHKTHQEDIPEGGEHTCKPQGFPLLLKDRLHRTAETKAEGSGEETEEQHGEAVHSASLRMHSGSLGLPCCYIYTADLDGSMRATFLSHWRFISAGLSWQLAVPLSSSDRLLVSVHLSHEVGLHALASAIACRGTLLLRARSSLLALWPDLRALDCSVLWHTGTMWARLLKAHERFHKGEETQRLGSWGKHPALRASIGTGLPGDLWPVVQKTFNIPSILEFHSFPNLQTGHVLLNSWGMMGACGFIPNSAWEAKGVDRLVAFDEESEEIERDKETKRGREAPRDPATHRQRGRGIPILLLALVVHATLRSRQTGIRSQVLH